MWNLTVRRVPNYHVVNCQQLKKATTLDNYPGPLLFRLATLNLTNSGRLHLKIFF